jgi:hypothetical protein
VDHPVTLFNVAHQIHFGWVLCAAVVAVPLYLKVKFNTTIGPKFSSLLIAVPPLLSWYLFPKMSFTHITVIWALIAIVQTQRKRKQMVSGLVMKAALFFAFLLAAWNGLLFTKPVIAAGLIAKVAGYV